MSALPSILQHILALGPRVNPLSCVKHFSKLTIFNKDLRLYLGFLMINSYQTPIMI